ncbi:MAG: tRNA (adenosine(37)-N6)-threonylcarbamoyltransferase complex ATPase subunit type 1 TsaE [Paludibacteraceae bacterium]|nr:tRNA (adenosine(37)-N6)-threonylcarbamoyltransferase complex ATPase subunit type 1 TsaE [Paludibacteraceae bacterium]MBR6043887.1 tRNA (adenosine(37)-N6)-threonylcarbamoyltransferase complex ATPase subunit type 1 TsaE [Paludibacteraceae bacterium]MCR5568349.1 tRNA (adenosine(37)-N6)-threonylcarbamoyltransferase complex ATPase subunit type 1 TsaE [Paludibacteraceae bacterium]
MAFCIEIPSLDKISEAAAQFVAKMGNGKVYVFYGNMGAGKTTFIKAVCEQLGVTDVINSPTFAIVNEYEDGNGEPIYHFDFYRINKEEEAYDFGYEDYFYSGNVCFIEWPEMVKNLIPEDAIEVHIKENEDGTRTVNVG